MEVVLDKTNITASNKTASCRILLPAPLRFTGGNPPPPPSSNFGLGIFPSVLRCVETATRPHHHHSLLRRNAPPDFRCHPRLLSASPSRSNVPSSGRTPPDENHVFHSCNLTTISCGVFLLTPKSAQGRMRAIKFAVPARSPVRGLSCGSSGQALSFGGPRRAARLPGGSGDFAARLFEGCLPWSCPGHAATEVKLCSTCPA